MKLQILLYLINKINKKNLWNKNKINKINKWYTHPPTHTNYTHKNIATPGSVSDFVIKK